MKIFVAKMKCKYCDTKCHKKGKRNRRQQYQCPVCYSYQKQNYVRNSLKSYDTELLIKLNNEGLGIRSIGRVLNIPKSTVSKLIFTLSKEIKQPTLKESAEEYEIDELRTFIWKKENECWICYAINRNTKEVIDFVVGRRTKSNLKKIIDSILELEPKKIYTDKLNVYPNLIPKRIHSKVFKKTNHIERKNLTIRTHLKRLNRKTICFSKSIDMLNACLLLYFWVEIPT